MQVCDLEGNVAGVETLFNELKHIVEEEDGSFGCLHPDTLALYDRLTSAERAAPLVRAG